MNDDRLEVGKKYIYIIYSEPRIWCSAVLTITPKILFGLHKNLYSRIQLNKLRYEIYLGESRIDSHHEISVPYVPIYCIFVAWDAVCGRYWLVLSVGHVLRFR